MLKMVLWLVRFAQPGIVLWSFFSPTCLFAHDQFLNLLLILQISSLFNSINSRIPQRPSYVALTFILFV
jgi:hypothetical protein